MTAVMARRGLPWIAFAVALALATAPVWRLAARGFEPTVDELLQMRCSGSKASR